MRHTNTYSEERKGDAEHPILNWEWSGSLLAVALQKRVHWWDRQVLGWDALESPHGVTSHCRDIVWVHEVRQVRERVADRG